AGATTNSDSGVTDLANVAPAMEPLVQKLPNLKVVMEHITTSEAVAFVT
ncbi:unnamed protein product, partial [Ectocarpus sp. 12 AP-2014]